MSVQIDREYYSPEIYRVQSSSLNSTTPHPVNGILFTQVTTKYFDNTISAAPEFEFNRIVCVMVQESSASWGNMTEKFLKFNMELKTMIYRAHSRLFSSHSP